MNETIKISTKEDLKKKQTINYNLARDSYILKVKQLDLLISI